MEKSPPADYRKLVVKIVQAFLHDCHWLVDSSAFYQLYSYGGKSGVITSMDHLASILSLHCYPQFIISRSPLGEKLRFVIVQLLSYHRCRVLVEEFYNSFLRCVSQVLFAKRTWKYTGSFIFMFFTLFYCFGYTTVHVVWFNVFE